MSRRLTRALCAVAAASLAVITMGSARAGTAGAAPAVNPDAPQPGVTLALAGEVNAATDLFYTGTSGQLWTVHMSPMSENVPTPMGGKLTGGPAAVWIPYGTLPIHGLAVFGRGTDNQLWWRYQNSSGWTGWAPLGGVLTSRPAVSLGTAAAPGALTVFVRGSDGAVWGRTLIGTLSTSATKWTQWSSYGGTLLPGTAPAAAENAAGLFIAAVGTDQAVWVREQLAGKWLAWQPIGGQTTADPGIFTPSANAVVAFVRGTDQAAWYREFLGHTKAVRTGWNSLQGTLTSGPAAITQRESSQYGQTSVFVLGSDSRPWIRSGTWPALSVWMLARIGG